MFYNEFNREMKNNVQEYKPIIDAINQDFNWKNMAPTMTDEENNDLEIPSGNIRLYLGSILFCWMYNR